MTDTVELARERFVRERDRYEAAARDTAARLRRQAATARLSCDVLGRAKEVSAFVLKARVKHYPDPWAGVTDKAGVRVIVEHQGELDRAVDAVGEALTVLRVEDDRAAEGGEDRLAYQRLHVQVLAPEHEGDDPDLPIECEVQIRTAAQDLWSRSSHSLLYKPAMRPAKTVARPLYRLLALVELYDQETERVTRAMQAHPDYNDARLLREAEQVFHSYVGADYHRSTSEETIPVLLPLVGDVEAYGARLLEFAADHHGKLTRAYASYGPASDVGRSGGYLLMGQPESVVVFEQLDSAPEALRAAWDDALPADLLDEAASVWGAAA